NPRGQPLVAERLHLLASQQVVSIEPRLPSDRSRSGGVVAGNHDHVDAGRTTFRDGCGNTRPKGISKSNQPQEPEGEVVLSIRPFLAHERSLCDGQNAQTLCGHLVHRAGEGGNIRWTQMAEVSDSFWRAFGGDYEFLASVRRLPCVRHGQETGSEPIG